MSAEQGAGRNGCGPETRAREDPTGLAAVAVVHTVADRDKKGAEAEINEPRRVEDSREHHWQGEADDRSGRERPAEPSAIEAQEILSQKSKAGSPAGRERRPGRRLSPRPAPLAPHPASSA